MSEKKAIDSNYASEVAGYTQRVWKIYLQVGIIGLLIVTALWYIMSADARISNRYPPLIDASTKIKYEAAIAHLWFEEAISGDRSKNINSIWHHFSKAEWFTQVMLNGGQCEGVICIPLKDPKLIESINGALAEIKTFRIIAEERYANWENSSIGSEIDQRFDSIFNSLILKIDEVESALHLAMRRDIKNVRVAQSVLIVLCLILTGVIGIILHRFQRKQLINLSTVKASNQQLLASDQQLKAANQQLKAGEQQLRATNQQLQSSEQQQRAANQQLTASEQQLRASNQQLISSKQQQIAINQQLSASEQQLKASNLEILQSHQKLQLHVQHTPLGVIQWDTEFKVTEWNSAAEKIFGFTSEEALGRHAAGLIVPESAKEIVDQIWQGLLDQKGGERSTNKNSTKENKIIICEWYNTPLIDENNQTIGVASLVMDITDRKLAEIKLIESQKALLESQEVARVGSYILDIAAGLWTSSKVLDGLFGLENEGEKRSVDTWLSVIHPDMKEEMMQYFTHDVLEMCGRFDKEYKIIRNNDGAVRWVHGMGQLELNEKGAPITMIGTIQDISERKKADQALRESEQKFREIITKLPVPVVITDKEQNIELYNDKFTEIFGYTKEDITKAEDWWNTCYPDPKYRKTVRQGWEKATKVAHDENVEIAMQEWRIACKDGSFKDVEFKFMPLEDISLIIMNDITETKRLQELESRAERLETAGTIAGQVAHDFNNLLAPLMAYPEFIRDELPRNHPALEYLDQIETASHKIADINQDLLAMGRRGHYNQVALNLNAVVQQTLTELKPYPKSLIFEANLSDELMDILGGGAQLHRMISNLLHNAKDAMQDIGQITVRTENYYVDDVSVLYGRVPKGEYVKLTISDTGCGIPVEIIQKIFDPFFTSKTTDKRRGSGLGMSVVDAVIKDHHGFIDLSTKVGEGTSFYIYIPITRQLSDQTDSETITGGNEKILVVDDDDVQRLVSYRLLKKLGYDVSTVGSGEKALEFLRESRRDLIILDMVMPGGIDGTETYRQIIEISPGQKAIILSGFSESNRVLEIQKLGAGAFIKKPIMIKEIAAAVRTELERLVKKTSN